MVAVRFDFGACPDIIVCEGSSHSATHTHNYSNGSWCTVSKCKMFLKWWTWNVFPKFSANNFELEIYFLYTSKHTLSIKICEHKVHFFYSSFQFLGHIRSVSSRPGGSLSVKIFEYLYIAISSFPFLDKKMLSPRYQVVVFACMCSRFSYSWLSLYFSPSFFL